MSDRELLERNRRVMLLDLESRQGSKAWRDATEAALKSIAAAMAKGGEL